jgi:hypothetical protein
MIALTGQPHLANMLLLLVCVVAAEYTKMQLNENHADTQQQKKLALRCLDRTRTYIQKKKEFIAMPQHAS